MKLMMVCEDESDFRIASGLMERVAVENVVADWLRSTIADSPDAVRVWQRDESMEFFDIHRIADYCDRNDVRLPHGHFNGEAGRAGAHCARNTFALARRLVEDGTDIDVVLLVWDMDQDADQRKAGLEQAREEASARFSTTFKIVLGCPNAMMEAWVLAGFDACDDEERARLNHERTKIGFSPTTHSQNLVATSSKREISDKREDPLAKKSAKRVLAALTGGDADRILKCWKETPLETLRDRGEHNGLREYLKEVAEILVPLFAR